MMFAEGCFQVSGVLTGELIGKIGMNVDSNFTWRQHKIGGIDTATKTQVAGNQPRSELIQ